jgi:hypothetical protein
MFISRLKSKIHAYDPFGEFKTNAIKGLFVLELMFCFYFVLPINDPYFYYFYLPLTCFSAEIAGKNLKDKYLFLLFALVGSMTVVFFYGLLSNNKTVFIIFVFFSTMLIYYIAIHKIKSMMAVAPIILSLGAYSLLYGNTDGNFIIALNNMLKSVLAGFIIFSGLYIFPKKFYFVIWKKAFCDVLLTLDLLAEKIKKNEVKDVPVFKGFMIMGRYSKMVSKKVKHYSILRMTILALHLVMEVSYLSLFKKTINKEYIFLLQYYSKILLKQCKKDKSVQLAEKDKNQLSEIEELKTIRQLIMSWNYLCSNH